MTRWSPSKSRKDFEEDGIFYAGYISPEVESTRGTRRRVLCFVTKRGVVAASANFSRAEAYFTALKAERGLLPEPTGSAAPSLLARILRQRGFPVRNANDCVDDTTAEHLLREFTKQPQEG